MKRKSEIERERNPLDGTLLFGGYQALELIQRADLLGWCNCLGKEW